MSMSFLLERGVGVCASRVRVYRISRSPDAPSARIVPDTIDPLAQRGILTLQDVGEGLSVEFGHTQVTQEHVIAPLLELGQGEIPIACGVHKIAITAQEHCQRPN